MPVVTYDYPGKAVSISEHDELSDKVIDFMAGCNGLLFFYDPKMLGAELESQAHVSSFVNMLEQLAPLHRRLPIPIGLVVTKADILPGFSSDSQTVLIPGEDEHILAEDFETFLEHVLTSNRIASNSAWAGTVRQILVTLKEFLKVVIGRTLDFQIFFMSATGRKPEKIGADVGRSIYKPPEKMTPIGIKEPFYWILSSIRRSRGLSVMRKLAKYAAVLSLLWIVIFSLPYLWHFNFLLPRTTGVEDKILEAYAGNRFNISGKERKNIIDAYSKYERAKTTRWFFDRFRIPAGRIKERYNRINLGDAIGDLNRLVGRVTAIVQAPTLWPKVNPANDSLMLDDMHRELEAGLNSFHQGDETSILFTRSGRVLTYWELFKSALVAKDPPSWEKVVEQVDHDSKLYSQERSKEEIALGDAFVNAVAAQLQREKKTETAQQAGTELEQLIAQIKANPDPN
ncbi:MAG: hypothetical protein AB1744_13875, partial [Candidatus Zixiibacteriota bacterium]